MSTYFIHESNMERLEKKLASIEKKCSKTYCQFRYEVKGNTYRECEDADGNKYTAKYYEVEVEGTAKYNGWTFVATIDHHDEGNVIRAYNTELVVPDKYKTCGPTCEHCNKIRSRKDTYLIYNEDEGFKQVGRSCLKEFTNGLSAEDVALFCQYYEEASNSYGYSGTSYNRYINVEEILRYAFECFKHWGYQKSEASFYDEEVPVGYRSTRNRVLDYYYIERVMKSRRDEFIREMDEVGFDANSEYAVSTTEAALEWIRGKENADNEYIRNLHIICSDEYTDYRSLGILVSLTVAYARHLDQVAAYEEKQKKESEKKPSEYVGKVGQKITVKTSSFTCISSWYNVFGTTFLYKFTDENNNVYVWYASKCIDSEEDVISVTGTVKDHSAYNGVKQTVLTRCKVNYRFTDKDFVSKPNCDVQEALDTFFDDVNS